MYFLYILKHLNHLCVIQFYKKELADRIIELKDSMNTKRKNIILPVEHNITITKS